MKQSSSVASSSSNKHHCKKKKKNKLYVTQNEMFRHKFMFWNRIHAIFIMFPDIFLTLTLCRQVQRQVTFSEPEDFSVLTFLITLVKNSTQIQNKFVVDVKHFPERSSFNLHYISGSRMTAPSGVLQQFSQFTCSPAVMFTAGRHVETSLSLWQLQTTSVKTHLNICNITLSHFVHRSHSLEHWCCIQVTRERWERRVSPSQILFTSALSL